MSFGIVGIGVWFLGSVSKVRYVNELEPPAQYNHPGNGPIVERVMPVVSAAKLARGRVTEPAILLCQTMA